MAKILSAQMTEDLVTHAAIENKAANAYLAFAYWANERGLFGTEKWMKKSSDEEREHQRKILDYVSDTETISRIGAVPEVKTDGIKNMKTLFEEVQKLELEVTKRLEKIKLAAITEGDLLTDTFLDWYMDEQHDSLGTCRDILARLNLGGDVYAFDEWIEEL